MEGFFFFLVTVAIGFIAARQKLLPPEMPRILPDLLFSVCYPAMILETFLTIDKAALSGTGLPIVIATLAITAALFAMGQLLFRRFSGSRKALLIFLTGIGNVTYVSLPLFSVLLPVQGTLVGILHSTAQDPLIWGLYHPLLLESSGNERSSRKAALTSPCLLATATGIILCIAGVSPPDFLIRTLSRISAATSPIALLLIGMLMYQYGLFSWVRDVPALIYGIGKVIVLPVILAMLLPCFLPAENALLLALLFGSPAPLLSVAWAQKAHQQEAFSIHCFLFSTILYLIVMPPAVRLLVHLGLIS